MNIFDMIKGGAGSSLGGLGSLGNDHLGGFRTFIDMAQRNPNMSHLGDLMKEFMTNAPEGVSQLTKGPWNFGSNSES